MRINFTELKDIHKGQDIWTISGGASLDYVKDSFFDNKITMCLGEAFRRFKNMTYYMRKDGREYQGHDIIDFIQKETPNSKLIVSDYVGCVQEWGKNDFDTNMDYYYFEHPFTHGELSTNWNSEEGKFANGIGLTGIAIHLCAYMGAKNIIVCGNDTGFLDGKDYFDGYGVYDCRMSHIDTLNWGRPQTLEIVRYFRSQGVNIHGLNPFVELRLEGHSFSLKNPDGRDQSTSNE